jgi:hypothetical protein
MIFHSVLSQNSGSFEKLKNFLSLGHIDEFSRNPHNNLGGLDYVPSGTNPKDCPLPKLHMRDPLQQT